MQFIKKLLRNKLSLNDGILLSKINLNSTKEVIDFYSEAPFPNFDDFQNKNDLKRIIDKNPFLKDLKNAIGFGKTFIEVGSGTCQLSLALAINTNNLIVAQDPTKASLKLGKEFAKKNNINNVEFLNVDIFDDYFVKDFFDYVWCSGVLHHTKDPQKGFEIITTWLKPNGIIIVGLYNKIGRLRTNFRQCIYNFLGRSIIATKLLMLLDPHLRKNLSKAKNIAWIRDQYEHPIESKHSIDEVLKWFKNNNIDFVGSIPSSNPNDDTIKISEMNGEKGSYFSRVWSQIMMLFSPLGGEGGLFIVIGKKK